MKSLFSLLVFGWMTCGWGAEGLPAAPLDTVQILPITCYPMVRFVDDRRLAFVNAFIGVTAGMYDIETGTKLYETKFRGRTFHGLALSPDRERLATLIDGRGIVVWEARTGSLVVEIPFPAAAGDVAFSPDGKLLVGTSLLDRMLKVWCTQTWEERATVALPANPDAVAFSPDGKLIATGVWDAFMIVDAERWDVVRVVTLPARDHWIGLLVFSPDAEALVVGYADGAVRVYRWRENILDVLAVGHKGQVLGLAFSPDGRFLASGGADATVLIWEWPKGTLLYRLDLWDVFELERRIPEEQKPFARFAARVYWINFSPSGLRLATVGVNVPDRGCVHIWQLPSLLKGHGFP